MLTLEEKILFALLMAMAATWLIALKWLFRRLRMEHTEIYAALGSPTLLWNNSLKNNWLFLKFLFGRDSKGLDDAAIVRLCRFLRALLIAYICDFVALLTLTYLNL